MMRIKNLAAAIELCQAHGERPYGHYDHEAYCTTGPVETLYLVRSEPVEPLLEPARSVSYEVSPDPDTGEPLTRFLRSIPL